MDGLKWMSKSDGSTTARRLALDRDAAGNFCHSRLGYAAAVCVRFATFGRAEHRNNVDMQAFHMGSFSVEQTGEQTGVQGLPPQQFSVR